MAYNWKKKASAAHGFSMTRLAFNLYLYLEDMLAGGGSGGLPEGTLRRLTGSLGDTLTGQIRMLLDGSLKMEEVCALREDVRRTMEAVVAYTDCFSAYQYVLNRVERRFDKSLPAPELSDETFVSQVMGYAMAKEAPVMNRRVQDLIGQLPVRLTRQTYYSMVRDALSVYTGSDKSSLDQTLYLLRSGAMLARADVETCGMEELEQKLRLLEGLSFRDMTEEAYGEAVKAMAEASTALLAATGIYQLLGEMVNDLYVLCLTGGDAMRDLALEGHASAVLQAMLDVYRGHGPEDDFGGPENLEGLENPEGLGQGLEGHLEALEGRQEACFSLYQQTGPAPDYREGEPEEARRSRQVDLLLSNSIFVPLEDTCSPGTVTAEDVEQAFQAFVSELDPVLASCQKPVARAIMAQTLSCLPVAFATADDVRSYIENSLRACSDYAERGACMELVRRMMESEGYELV